MGPRPDGIPLGRGARLPKPVHVDGPAFTDRQPVAGDHRRASADYAMRRINQIRDGRVTAAAPTEVATKNYNELMKAAVPQTIWATGCNSWSLDKTDCRS